MKHNMKQKQQFQLAKRIRSGPMTPNNQKKKFVKKNTSLEWNFMRSHYAKSISSTSKIKVLPAGMRPSPMALLP